jgi:hypothetical protein
VRCHCLGHCSRRRKLLHNGDGEESCRERGRVAANTNRIQEEEWNRRCV